MILYTLIPLLAAVGGAVGLSLGLHLPAAWSWLISISVMTILTYGYDKAVSPSNRARVPEAVLLSLAFVGGTIGALLGMFLFHHKTSKASFQIRFWTVVALQVLLVVAYFIWGQAWVKATFG